MTAVSEKHSCPITAYRLVELWSPRRGWWWWWGYLCAPRQCTEFSLCCRETPLSLSATMVPQNFRGTAALFLLTACVGRGCTVLPLSHDFFREPSESRDPLSAPCPLGVLLSNNASFQCPHKQLGASRCYE